MYDCWTLPTRPSRRLRQRDATPSASAFISVEQTTDSTHVDSAAAGFAVFLRIVMWGGLALLVVVWLYTFLASLRSAQAGQKQPERPAGAPADFLQTLSGRAGADPGPEPPASASPPLPRSDGARPGSGAAPSPATQAHQASSSLRASNSRHHRFF